MDVKFSCILLLAAASISLLCIEIYRLHSIPSARQLPPLATQRKQLGINNESDTSPPLQSDALPPSSPQLDEKSVASISPLSQRFRTYLDPLCLSPPNITTYPPDCQELLQSLLNITATLNLDEHEIDILAQRVEYLNTPNYWSYPILYIHIPKTGGTGFGDWLKFSQKTVVHLWIPDNMEPGMFDEHHYAKRPPSKRGLLSTSTYSNTSGIFYESSRRQLRIKKPAKPKEKPPFPDILYGHAAYGFDILFLSPQEVEALSQSPPQIVWKPRVNFTYITIIRNPMTRVASHYFYQKKGVKDENHRWTVNRDLNAWVGWFEESKECLVQFISGCHQRAWYSRENASVWDPKLNAWPRRQPDESPDIFNRSNVSFEQYKIARLHLLEMGWVGLTEYLAESVEQFKVFLGISSKQGSKRENVNRSKPKNAINEATMKKIREYNKYDLALFELGNVLFRQQQIVIKYGYNVNIQRRMNSAIHVKQKSMPKTPKRKAGVARKTGIVGNKTR